MAERGSMDVDLLVSGLVESNLLEPLPALFLVLPVAFSLGVPIPIGVRGFILSD